MAFLTRKTSVASQITDSSYLDRPRVTIGETVIPVEVAASVEEINKGLSHRRTLEASHGMLFLFDHDARFRFWMRGMRFPLDILWIDANYRIVDISENVPVQSFVARVLMRAGRARFYSPSVPARYVLEVNAHFCGMNGVQIGDIVEFVSLPL